MLVDPVHFAVVAVATIALSGGVWWRRRRSIAGATRAIATAGQEAEIATRIIVGTSADQPAFQIAITLDEASFAHATEIPGIARLDLSGLSVCLQAVPSVLVQQAHQGRHLMEVVINNPLANSASGNHFLPFAKGADGRIIEQAKLLNPQGLTSLVNAAAVWQVASVVVAQKHLADISAKLDEIKQGIDDLKNLFQDKLNGDIEGIYRYLRTVAKSFEKGDVPKDARGQLESCRLGLLQAESALQRMFNRKLEQTIEHKEIAGTGDLLKDTLQRYDELDQIRSSLMTCLKTQALAWYVLSLFPGEGATADLWKEDILDSLATFSQMQQKVTKTAGKDIERFQALFNWESTLEERRRSVSVRAERAAFAFYHASSDFQMGMYRAASMLEHNNDPIRLGVEIVDGSIKQVRVMD